MADITLCVMLPPRGDTTFDRSAHSKMPALSPVCVYPLQKIDEVTAPRTGYIHVTGCPVQVTPDRLTQRICQAWEEGEIYLAKRLWVGLASALTLRQKADLLRDRQTTLTWAEFRDAFVRQDTGETIRQEITARALG